MARDTGLDTLLDLDESIIDQGDGYWIKIEARKVKPTESRPHGVKYSLSLHEPYGERIMEFDNAHSITTRAKGNYRGAKFAYDHKHRSTDDKGKTYTFSDPYQLLEDFFKEVDKTLKEHGKKNRGK